MKKQFFALLMALVVVMTSTLMVSAEEGNVDGGYYTFTDRNGNTVTAPINAFAYRVISFTPGSPWITMDRNNDPNIALGLPDASDSSDSMGDLCMGRGGVLVLGFDTPIYDGDGEDIYIFEVGGNVESTKVEVSSDLITWYEIGIAEGRTAGLDFTGIVPVGSSFQYVRLTDTGENPDGSWPGADIDTVCGLNTKPVTATTKNAILTYRGIKIRIDGQLIQPVDVNGNSVDPFIYNDSTYLPLRAVAGALGLKVDWDDPTSTITLTSGAQKTSSTGIVSTRTGTVQAILTFRGIRIVLDGKNVIPKDVNGTVLDPFIYNGTTYLPVRALASALGCEVGWDDATSTVSIRSA